MYRAYDRHLYERAPAVPARQLTHPGPRTVIHPLLFCPPLPQDTRYMPDPTRVAGRAEGLGHRACAVCS
jgi:hypothetical protein